MTKKDYELFAHEINVLYKNKINITAVISVCRVVFKYDNPLFSIDKFERACYEGKHIRKSISGKL